MKGKKADASERRRQMEALEKRAETAEQRAGDLAAELSDLRNKFERQTLAYRRELAELVKQRDAATSPLLAKAQSELVGVQQRLKEANVDKAAYLAAIDRFRKHMYRALGDAGLSETEIAVVMARFTGEIRHGLSGVFFPTPEIGGA